MKFVTSIIRWYHAVVDTCLIEKELRPHMQFGREYVRICKKDDAQSPVHLDLSLSNLVERYVHRMNKLTTERFASADEECARLVNECHQYVKQIIGYEEDTMSLAKQMLNIEALADAHAAITAQQVLGELHHETQNLCLNEMQKKEIRRRICFRYRLLWGYLYNYKK